MPDADRATAIPRDTLRDFHGSLPMALMRAREAVMNRFRPMLLDHGVTEQQWRVLRALQDGPRDISSLARRCCILGPSLTRILRNLESRAFVRRRTDKGDGRISVIALAPAGSRLIDQVAPHSEAHYAAIADALGAEKLDALYALLEEVEETLGG